MRPVSEQFYDDDVDDGDEDDDESSDGRPEDTSKEELKVSQPPPCPTELTLARSPSNSRLRPPG